MRSGLDDTSESRDKFYQIFDGTFEHSVAAITVHGRTVEQEFVGASRWEFLREVKQHAGSRVVIGSGDLFTPQACIDMIEQGGVDGALGRARRHRESVDLQPGPGAVAAGKAAAKAAERARTAPRSSPSIIGWPRSCMARSTVAGRCSEFGAQVLATASWGTAVRPRRLRRRDAVPASCRACSTAGTPTICRGVIRSRSRKTTTTSSMTVRHRPAWRERLGGRRLCR